MPSSEYLHALLNIAEKGIDKNLQELFTSLYGQEAAENTASQNMHIERIRSLMTRHASSSSKPSESSSASNPSSSLESGDQDDILIFSTPGRTELGGNHTDHNHGKVLAGAVNLDTLAAVSPRSDNRVIIDSEGYPRVEVDISTLTPQKSEKNTTEALVRGIAAYFIDHGHRVGGFQASTTSRILKGSGLSSSAAVEVLIGTIWNNLYNDDTLSSVELAKAGQFAENNYFGKPCGLMDQTACAHGGIIGIDFREPANPAIEPVHLTFAEYGWTLAVVDTGGNHADLTNDYAAIPEEMQAAAQVLGKTVCRDISYAELLSHAGAIREACGDRAFLRALHFINDNSRVQQQIDALKQHDIKRYLSLVRESGKSSLCCLQNIFPCSNPAEQGISVGLAMTEEFFRSHQPSKDKLQEKGAARVHGGGFAGTIQAYIPCRKSAWRRVRRHHPGIHPDSMVRCVY